MCLVRILFNISCDNDDQLFSIELDAGPLSCQPNRIQSKRANIFIQCHVNLYQCRQPVVVYHARKVWMDWVALMQIKSMKKVAHQITALVVMFSGNNVKLVRRKMAVPISSTPTAYQMGKFQLCSFLFFGFATFQFHSFLFFAFQTHTHTCMHNNPFVLLFMLTASPTVEKWIKCYHIHWSPSSIMYTFIYDKNPF